MQVLVGPEAEADIREAHAWYEAQRPGLGDAFAERVRAALAALAANPERYPVLHRDTRRVLLERFPYGLYYRVFADVVVVVACMHGRRDPRRWRSRTGS